MTNARHTQTQADIIIGKFGGVCATAHAIEQVRGSKTFPSMAQKWRSSGFIPGRWWETILDASDIVGAGISDQDFIAHLKRRK